MGYKNVYIKNFGEVLEGYEIHHIDLNRKNNNPYNLVAIPRKLHKEYHKFLNANLNLKEKEYHKVCIYGFGNNFLLYQLDKLQTLLNEINYYVLTRNSRVDD